MTLLVRDSAVYMVLGRVPGFDVGQESIIAAQQLTARLASQNQVLLVLIVAHHDLGWGSLILLARRLLDLRHWRLNAQTLVAFNSFLIIAWDSLRGPILLVLIPQHLVRRARNACSWHWVIKLWLIALWMLWLHFRLYKNNFQSS